MLRKWHYYVISLQYLGYRYHGWQKQKDSSLKTVEGMLQKTLKWVLKDAKFKTLGAGRTDARVSANQTAFELFTANSLPDMQVFLDLLNENFPADIRAVAIQEVTEKFNIINDAKQKEYLYLFSYGEKNHPFAAPFMVNIPKSLDIELMQQGALLFEGEHYFKSYCARPKEHTKFVREVHHSQISKNDLYTASFFPKESYIFRVRGPGFMRYQVRLMMGALFSLGVGELTLEDIRNSLQADSTRVIKWVAPSSGLILNNVRYEKL